MFTLIDYDAWPRREIYAFFHKTTIYMTVELDVTELWERHKKRGLRLYPALLYGAARVVNGDPAFRYGYDGAGRIGLWDELTPYYTVPRSGEGELFSITATPYRPDFPAFYAACLEDMEEAAACGRLLCRELPENGFGVSVVPGTSFTGFNFNGDPKTDLNPFVLYGRVHSEGERTRLPVSAEFSHGVNDGVHVSRFFRRLEEELRGLEP